MVSRDHVKLAIDNERDYQDAKWGSLEEHPHSLPEWIMIMKGELREAEDAWLKCHGDAAVKLEILQVVAVGVACLEQHGPAVRSPNGTAAEIVSDEQAD